MRHNTPRTSADALLLGRSIRCTVLHPDDEDGETLADHLRRMGFKVRAFWPVPDKLPADTDLVFLALRSDLPEPEVPWLDLDKHALISVIEYENPTFIDTALRLGAGTTLTTPVRATGLLSAMVFALHHAQRRRHMGGHIERLEKKVLGLRQVSEAKAILMRMHAIGEEQAYDILRHQAMDKRITVEDMARALIQANDIFSWTTPGAPPGRKK